MEMVIVKHFLGYDQQWAKFACYTKIWSNRLVWMYIIVGRLCTKVIGRINKLIRYNISIMIEKGTPAVVIKACHVSRNKTEQANDIK